MNHNVESLRHLRAYATPAQVRDGRQWYKLALMEATDMAMRYDVPVRTAAGVIAALSPRKTWAQNVRLAHELLSGGETRTLSAHRLIANRIIGAEHLLAPDEVMRGPKTRAFYRAIMGDVDAVVLDVWMLRALGVSSAKLTPKQYEMLAEVVRAEAIRVGEMPAEYQAIVWCAIRGKSF